MRQESPETPTPGKYAVVLIPTDQLEPVRSRIEEMPGVQMKRLSIPCSNCSQPTDTVSMPDPGRRLCPACDRGKPATPAEGIAELNYQLIAAIGIADHVRELARKESKRIPQNHRLAGVLEWNAAEISELTRPKPTTIAGWLAEILRQLKNGWFGPARHRKLSKIARDLDRAK